MKRFLAYLLLSSITNRSSVGSDIVGAQPSPAPGSFADFGGCVVVAVGRGGGGGQDLYPDPQLSVPVPTFFSFLTWLHPLVRSSLPAPKEEYLGGHGTAESGIVFALEAQVSRRRRDLRAEDRVRCRRCSNANLPPARCRGASGETSGLERLKAGCVLGLGSGRSSSLKYSATRRGRSGWAADTDRLFRVSRESLGASSSGP